MPAKNVRRLRHIAPATVTAGWRKARSAYIPRREFGGSHLPCAPAAGSTAGDDWTWLKTTWLDREYNTVPIGPTKIVGKGGCHARPSSQALFDFRRLACRPRF